MFTEKEFQTLQNRVIELERQLAEAQAASVALTSLRETETHVNDAWQIAEELNAIIQTLHDPVMVYDQNGVISMANASAIRAHGFDPTGYHRRESNQTLMVRYPSGEAVHPDDLPSARALKGETVIDEALIITNSHGQELNILVTSSPLVVSDVQRGALAVWHDVTEQKETEKALTKSRQRINDILGSLGDGLFALNREWAIIYVNRKAAQIAGYSVDELVGKNLWELWPQLRGTALESFYRQAMENGIPGQFRVQGRLSDRWYDVSVYPSSEGITVFYLDKTEQIRAEEALRESQDRFAKAFHASPNALVISRQADGRIETVNETFVNFFGYSEEEVIGRTSTELGMFVNPADRQEAVQRLQAQKFVRDFELDVRLRSGESRNVSLSIEIMNIGREHVMLTMIQDITDRKQFEIALRKRESILTQAGEIAHLGAWDIEFHNQEDVNANPLSWSDEVYRIFGYAPGEVRPSNELFFERVHPDDRVLVQESVAQAIATRRPYKIEHRVRRPDGEERIVQEHAEVFFDESGKPLRIVGAVQDITERKRAEEALRESEERFRSLADSMPQLVWTALPDGTVDYYNERYQEYQEIKQVQKTTWEWAPVLHPEDLQPTVDTWQRSLETGETYQIEHRVRMADGSYRWHLSRGVPMFDEKGQIVRWFGTATDIHDLKLAEEQLKVYTERLERSNRELEQFAFMASHDLQEPLRKIEVFGDLLLESSTSLGGRERNYLDRMRDAAKRMRDMVDGLLQLSRVTTQGKPFIQVSLSQVIEDVLYNLENQIRRTNGKVDVGTLSAIDGDPLQLRQLMQNLIGNALKYHQPDTPPEVKIHAEQFTGKVRIFVEDNGIGFEQADAERIFKPFQRLVGRSQYEGSGMGLALCRRIVERHGGEITARSQPGHGTTFIVTLPMYQAKVARKDVSNEESGTAPDRRG